MKTKDERPRAGHGEYVLEMTAGQLRLLRLMCDILRGGGMCWRQFCSHLTQAEQIAASQQLMGLEEATALLAAPPTEVL